MNGRTIKTIARHLLVWYGQNARDLPWRHDPSPYRVWISEVMLQQTSVSTVQPYFERWLKRFPDLQALASASEQEVLALWQGMGYYQRARRLHAAARQVVQEHGGQIPRDRADLLKLPGVGPYVAGAIRSLAFGEDEPAVDANVIRVMMRLLALPGKGSETGVRAQVQQWVRTGLPGGRSAEYNQAWMDFGSMICRPRRPRCGVCFLRRWCQGFQQGVQYDIPEPSPKRLSKITTAVAVFVRDGAVYIQQRPADGMFGSMWEFPGGKVKDGETPQQALVRECREELGIDCHPGQRLARLVHYYTVFEVTLHAFKCRPPGGLPADRTHRWVALADLQNYPMPSANRQVVQKLQAGA